MLAFKQLPLSVTFCLLMKYFTQKELSNYRSEELMLNVRNKCRVKLKARDDLILMHQTLIKRIHLHEPQD